MSYDAIAACIIGGVALVSCCCFVVVTLGVCCIACVRKMQSRSDVKYYRGLPVNVKSRSGGNLGMTIVTPDGVEVVITKENQIQRFSNPYIPPAQDETAESPPHHSVTTQTLTRQETSYTSVCSTSYAIEMAKAETLKRTEETN